MNLINWLHAWLVVPLATWWETTVLGTWEEVVMGVIRQTFQDCTRFLNGLSSWLLSFFQRDYRETLRRSWEENPWHNWWHQAQARPSTLNALIAAMHQQQQQEGEPESTPPTPTQNWTSGLTSMFSGRPSTSTTSTQDEEEDEQLSGTHPCPLQTQRSAWPGWLGHQQQRQQQGTQSAGRKGAAGAGAKHPPPPHAAATTPSKDVIAGAAAGAGTAPPQRLSATHSQRAKVIPSERASRPAGTTVPPARPVIFVQQSGMGILESLKRTGLLEDTRLAIELRVSQTFEWARRLLRAACHLPPPLTSSLAFSHVLHAGVPPPQLPPPSPPHTSHTAFGTLDSGLSALGVQPQVAVTPGAETKPTPHLPPSWLDQLPRRHSAHVHMLDDIPLLPNSTDPSPYSPHASPSTPSSPALPQQQRTRRKADGPPSSTAYPAAVNAGLTVPGVGMSAANGPHAASTVLKRSASSGAMESVCQHLSQVTTAGDVIRLAGYPLEVHTVTTDDGYILRMERIPRPGSRDAVFFMHGVLDTSMAWVSAGVTGSQAFAAWDAGYDVWLGNSRCNAPRLHQDPRKASTRVAYWRYSCNELGIQDVAAQLERLHNVKCTELGRGQVGLDLDHLGPLASLLLPNYHAPPKASLHSKAITPSPSMSRRSGEKVSPRSSGDVLAGAHPPKAASFPPEPPLRINSSVPDKHSRSHQGAQQQQQQQAQQRRGMLRHQPRDKQQTDRTQQLNHGKQVPDEQQQSLIFPQLQQQQRQAQQAQAQQQQQQQQQRQAQQAQQQQQQQQQQQRQAQQAQQQQQQQQQQRQAQQRQAQQQQQQQPCQSSCGLQRLSSHPLPIEEADLEAVCEQSAVPQNHSHHHSQGRLSRHHNALQQQQHELLQPHQHRRRSDKDSARPGVNGRASHSFSPPSSSTISPSPTPSASPSPTPTPAPIPTHSIPTLSPHQESAPPPPFVHPNENDLASNTKDNNNNSSNNLSAPNSISPFALFTDDHAPNAASSGHAQPAVAHVSGTTGQQQRGPAVHASATAGESACPGTSQQPHSVSSPNGSIHQAAGSSAHAAAGNKANTQSEREAKVAGSDSLAAGKGGGAHTALRHRLSSSPSKVSSTEPGWTKQGAGPVRPSADPDTVPTELSKTQGGTEASRPSLEPEPSLPSWHSTLLGGFTRGTGLENLGQALAPVGAAMCRGAAAAAGMGRRSDEVPSKRASLERGAREPEPYRLRAVGHSLGGMSLIMHAVMVSAQGRPTRIHRLILFTPAGVHAQLPRVAHPIALFLPPLVWLARLFWPSLAAPVYIPTTLARGLTFKLMADLRAIPSLAELLNLAIRGLLSGDASQWDRALQMPHYGAKAMPACSLHQCIHMAQIARSGKFRLFDYGSAKANLAAYGTPHPPDIVEQYGSLDIPVDLVAGTRDGVIPPHNIRLHYEAMKAAGVQVSYREFDFGHLDFTFAAKEELKRFLLHALRK